MDYEIPRDIGVVDGLNLRITTNNSATSLLGPPTAYWIQQVEFYLGSNLIETLYPHEMLSELSKQSLTLAKEVMKFNIYVTQRVDFQYGSQ